MVAREAQRRRGVPPKYAPRSEASEPRRESLSVDIPSITKGGARDGSVSIRQLAAGVATYHVTMIPDMPTPRASDPAVPAGPPVPTGNASLNEMPEDRQPCSVEGSG